MVKSPWSAPAVPDSNLSAGLIRALRSMIADGRLAAGARVNEVRLALELGVSRTPLRETLGRLVGEGALTERPRFGYYVRPLAVEEARDLYALRALVEPEALRLAGAPDGDGLKRLRALNQALAAAGGPEEASALDEEWHAELFGRGANRALVELSAQLRARTSRYQIALRRERRDGHAGAREHDKVLAALRAGNVKQAAETLRQSLLSALAEVGGWLAARPATVPAGREIRGGGSERRKKKLKRDKPR